ncbi:MAG: hypothetical protein ABJR46_13020 [Tateyamaria sp.]|uniref:hypothetical protein n=1 Tax=Tateyamaria sp. TaxID=1929288 RepID=UPI00329EFA3F
MLKGDRNGDVARGVIIGFLVGGVLFTALGQSSIPVDVTTQAISDCSTNTDNCANNREGVPSGWYWFRRLFALEDTIAQWIMMAFTIAAAGLLLATLTATRDMAKSTREIGQSQVRAYLTIESISFHPEPSDRFPVFAGRVVVKNTGQSPAINVFIDVKVISERKKVTYQIPHIGANDSAFFDLISTIQTGRDPTSVHVRAALRYSTVFSDDGEIEGGQDLFHGSIDANAVRGVALQRGSRMIITARPKDG